MPSLLALGVCDIKFLNALNAVEADGVQWARKT